MAIARHSTAARTTHFTPCGPMMIVWPAFGAGNSFPPSDCRLKRSLQLLMSGPLTVAPPGWHLTYN